METREETREERRATAWWRQGICTQIGSELFFTEAGVNNEEAKRACRTLCPVQDYCLADALETDIEHGVFGGYSRTDRRAMRRRVERGEDPLFVARDVIDAEYRRAVS